jgi:glycosyltransferase involved in cell wall biosynthesis
MEEIKVSIICNTYNQEDYIRDAIESFLEQETDFSYEILIHDDASNDGTKKIIEEYATCYPEIIRPFYQEENQYSKGAFITRQYQYPRVKGKYTTICEGDDYWIDTHKLQKQVDVLEKNPGCDICVHAAIVVDATTKKRIRDIAPSDSNTLFSTEEVISGGGGFVATNSIMIRSTLINDFPAFRNALNIDYTMQINGALRGGMLYLADCMSAYRFAAKSSWTEKMSKDSAAYCKHIKEVINMLTILDEETYGKYTETIKNCIFKEEGKILLKKREYKKIFKGGYDEYLKGMSKTAYIKLWLKAYLPALERLNNWIKKRGGNE